MKKHIHHIIPKYMGGSNDPSNLIELTVLEHALAHLNLYEEYGNPNDLLAYNGLMGLKDSAECAAEASRIANLGKKPSPETLEKKRQTQLKRIAAGIATPPTNKGMPRDEEWRSKMRVSMQGNKNGLGTKRTEEQKKRMSEAQKRRFGSAA